MGAQHWCKVFQPPKTREPRSDKRDPSCSFKEIKGKVAPKLSCLNGRRRDGEREGYKVELKLDMNLLGFFEVLGTWHNTSYLRPLRLHSFMNSSDLLLSQIIPTISCFSNTGCGWTRFTVI